MTTQSSESPSQKPNHVYGEPPEGCVNLGTNVRNYGGVNYFEEIVLSPDDRIVFYDRPVADALGSAAISLS